MGRIADTFAALAKQGRKGLIPYIMAGDPSPALTVDLLHTLVEGGADVIELGVPFSDPSADGPTIQAASEHALRQGIGLPQVLDQVRRFRESDTETPVVLMGYANPIERYDQLHGEDAFVRDAAEAGVDGILVVDYPPEESESFAAKLRAHGMDQIFLLAPTSTDERIQQVARIASGYVYYVSLKGVTGAASPNADDVAEHLAPLRQLTNLPLCVGFGIRDGASAAEVARVADGVIVGSALVSRIAENEHTPRQAIAELKALLSEMRQALDA